MRPDERGAIKLTRAYGDQLLCVRYRGHPSGGERLTTIELVVERVVVQPRKVDIVAFKIKPDEEHLRRLAMAKGATFDRKTKMWRLARNEVLRMGLRNRIAVPEDQLLQEHVGE